MSAKRSAALDPVGSDRSLDELVLDEGLTELASLAAVGQSRVVGSNRVPESGEGAGQARRRQYLSRVLEAVCARQSRRRGHPHPLKLDLGLPHGAHAALALHHHGVEFSRLVADEGGR